VIPTTTCSPQPLQPVEASFRRQGRGEWGATHHIVWLR
jgi:hypothetical protein